MLALDLGAAFLGFVFAAESPRRVDAATVATIARDVRGHPAGRAVRLVGVFVEGTAPEIAHIVAEAGLDAVQLHRPVQPGEAGAIGVPVIPAFRMRGPELAPQIEAALQQGPVLLDAYHPDKHGGIGEPFDHALARPFLGQGPVFIAGGLKPTTIAATARGFAGRGAQPYCYDVSSGLEASPGVKDPRKLRAFFEALRGALPA